MRCQGHPCSEWTISQPLQSSSKNPEHHGRMKHLSLRLFWLRDAVEDGLIEPSFVSTDEMAADIFTKALDRFKVRKCAQMLGLG